MINIGMGLGLFGLVVYAKTGLWYGHRFNVFSIIDDSKHLLQWSSIVMVVFSTDIDHWLDIKCMRRLGLDRPHLAK
jgi:hypothetical protein